MSLLHEKDNKLLTMSVVYTLILSFKQASTLHVSENRYQGFTVKGSSAHLDSNGKGW